MHQLLFLIVALVFTFSEAFSNLHPGVRSTIGKLCNTPPTAAHSTPLAIAANMQRCTATALLGMTCSAECDYDLGMRPRCEAGLWSVTCFCEPFGINPPPPPSYTIFHMHPVSQQVVNITQSFIAWAREFGTEGMTRLADRANDVINAYASGNPVSYDRAERAFSQQFKSLSQAEKEAARGWFQQHGY